MKRMLYLLFIAFWIVALGAEEPSLEIVLSIDRDRLLFNDKATITLRLKNSYSRFYKMDDLSFFYYPSACLSLYYEDKSGFIELGQGIYATLLKTFTINPEGIGPQQTIEKKQTVELVSGKVFEDIRTFRRYAGDALVFQFDGVFVPIPPQIDKLMMVATIEIEGIHIESNKVEIEIVRAAGQERNTRSD